MKVSFMPVATVEVIIVCYSNCFTVDLSLSLSTSSLKDSSLDWYVCVHECSECTSIHVYICSIQMPGYTHAVRVSGHMIFLGATVSMNILLVYPASIQCSYTGHYQQDANTYASWGVECMFTEYTYMYVIMWV